LLLGIMIVQYMFMILEQIKYQSASVLMRYEITRLTICVLVQSFLLVLYTFFHSISSIPIISLMPWTCPVLVQSFLTPRPLGGYLSGFPSSMGWNTLFWRLGDQMIESWNLKGGCAYGLNFVKICLLSTEEQFITSNQITIN
jgi:hypothetical protein